MFRTWESHPAILVAFRRPVCYCQDRKAQLSALPVFGKAVGPPRQGATSCPLISREGGCPMVTYGELFQYTLVIIGIIGLFIAADKKK